MEDQGMRDWIRLAIAGVLGMVLAGSVLAQSKPAAVVNGEAIPLSEVESILALRPVQPFPIPDAQQRLIRHEIVEMLISEKLMKQYLAKHTPAVDQTEVAKQMGALMDSLKAQGKTLAEFCKESRQTESQLRAGIINMIQFNAHARQSATEAELKKYFEENLDYFMRTTVRVSHIVIRTPTSATPAERDQARKRLVEIRQNILAGKVTFADAARENSQCPSGPKGGDIGVVSRKWMLDEAVAKVAFALKKDEISDVVESEFGLHLVKVTERAEGKKVEFLAVIDDVRDSFIEELRQKLLIELRRTAKVELY